MLIFGLKKWQAFYKSNKNREHHWLRIIGYVIRGVRLLAAPWRARGHSIWHLKVCHKGSVALFGVFEHFFVLASLCFFHWLDQAHLGGWVGRRRCPPRSRVRSGPAGLGPRVG